MYPICVSNSSNVSSSLKFQSFSLCGKPFSSYMPFETNSLNDTKWPSTLQGQMYPIYVLVVSPSPEFHFVLLYDYLFSRDMQFWDKCTECPQMTLNPTRPNVPHICVTSIHESQPSVCFTLRPIVFEKHAILRQGYRRTPNDLKPYTVKCAKNMYY